MREILKAFFKTGGGSVAAVLLTVIALKILAAILGPRGIGLFSLLRQIQQTAVAGATLSGQTALVQGGSSQKGQARHDYLRTVLLLFLVVGVAITGTMIFSSSWIAHRIIGQDDPTTVSLVRWLALPVLLNILVVYAMGVLNVYRAIGRLAIVQAGTALGLALSAYPLALAVKSGHELGFIGIIGISWTMGMALGVAFLWREGSLLPILSGLSQGFKREAARHFFSFAGTTAVTALLATGALLILRAIVVNQAGLAGAGIFDAPWTLSMGYVMLVLTSFQTYYLPTLTQTETIPSRVALMQRLFRVSTLLMTLLVIVVIVMKPLIISLLYSTEFTASLTIWRWMLIGDYFKVTSWIFAMPMLAHADLKTFFWTEAITNTAFLALATGLVVGTHSLQGIGVAFALSYLGYLIYTFHYARTRHGLTLRRPAVLSWLGGLALILGCSLETWSATQVNWGTAGLWAGAVGCFAFLGLSAEERRQIMHTALRTMRI